MKPLIIVLFGPDGAGKTTQAKLLIHFLRKQHKTVRMEISSRHLLMYVITRVFESIGKTTMIEDITRPLLPRDRIRLIIEFFSVLIKLIKINLLLCFGYYIVIEKYIPFTIASFHYLFKKSWLLRIVTSFLFSFILSENTILFYLDIPYEVACVRYVKRGHKAAPRSWFKFQRSIYSKFTHLQNCIRIETSSMTIKKTHELIKSLCLEWVS